MKRFLFGTVWRTAALAVFLAACTGIMVFLYDGTGARLPVVDDGEYVGYVTLKDGDNIITGGRVQMAGVRVGVVRATELTPDGLRVEFALDDEVVPLHQGVAVRLGERSLVGESYLDVTDGDGPPLPSGSPVPPETVQPSTQLRDVLASLDPQTRDQLGGLVRTLGQGTEGTQEDVSRTLDGLGGLGREGHTAVDAIAAQSEDLKALADEATAVLSALDTGQGQIAALVTNTNRLTGATAGQREAIEATLREIPGTLDSLKTASVSLNKLSGALAPIAVDLKIAAPSLSAALRELPATTADLRGLLTPLSDTLDRAPDTLNRVPRLGGDVRTAIPPARSILRDVNPMLAYLKPYGPELAAYFANFNAVLQYTDESGAHYLRLTPMINEKVQSPVPLEVLTYTNPYPAPGTGATPGPFTGPYPRVERDGG
ncbi:MlaD family protein [Amycolatopsis thermoflava]|uniref:MlaD family protein n=1 Tax=Amycolatopsis thermoflava TaxID=84480 RepID=UPI0038136484